MKEFDNFKNSNAVSLDFAKIEDKVSENIDTATRRGQNVYGGFKLKNILRYALCIMLTCVVSVGSTLLIQGSMLRSDRKGSGVAGLIDPGKDVALIEEHFDSFFAFNSFLDENIIELYWANVPEYCLLDILGTDIISEDDKNVIREFEASKGRTGNNLWYYNVYMGTKDGKDIVVLNDLGSATVFTFDSNLKYSFSSVINKFEELSGENLTQEFLLDCGESEPENKTWCNTAGINIRFILNKKDFNDKHVKTYFEYYHATINGQVYIVTGTQMLNS